MGLFDMRHGGGFAPPEPEPMLPRPRMHTFIISLRSFCRVCRFPSFVPSCRCPVVGAECRVRASVRPCVRVAACPSVPRPASPPRVSRSPRAVVKDHLREKNRDCALTIVT